MKYVSGKGQTVGYGEMDHHADVHEKMEAAHSKGHSFHHGLPDGHEDGPHAAAMAAGASSSLKMPDYGKTRTDLSHGGGKLNQEGRIGRETGTGHSPAMKPAHGLQSRKM